jgi:2-hydroxy-3-oxopropionate reductase
MRQKIGLIGLGIMGGPMAKNLMKADYQIIVHDINREAVQELIALGAEEAHSPKEIAQKCDVIITMLPDSPDVEEVALGKDGLLEGVREGQLYIDMSTIAPTMSMHVGNILGEKGVDCLDAPVSGGDVGAIKATLSIMVGGEEATFKRALPIFETLGNTITHCGPSGAGQTVKACNQIQVALNLVGMAEALVLGAKAGVDPEVIIKVLSGGYAQTRVMDARGQRVISGDFEPGFKSKFHYKDLNIIMQTGRDFTCPLPATALVRELFATMLARGRGDLDHSGVLTVIEDMADIKARTKQSV